MDLSEFVTNTLVQIQLGVQNAITQAGARGMTGVINPVWGSPDRVSRSDLREVTFDVAVTVADKSVKAVDGGIKVWAIGVAGDRETSAERSDVSRIQFSIPVIPPMTTINSPSFEPVDQ